MNLGEMMHGVKGKMGLEISEPWQVIDSAEGLRRFVRSAKAEPALAVDLEADSMYHFREKVCLIQMATPDRAVVIDVLAVEAPSLLKPLFADAGIRKIFHGADYDVRSLFRDFRIPVAGLFDTQIACRFLGMSETGLEAVLRNEFQLTLNKKFQKKDWSKRPLPEEMIAYAAMDVAHLLPLAERLTEALKAKGRLAWVEEECRILESVRSPVENGEPLFLRFKGAGYFRPRGLAVLEALLQCRQRMAEKRDKPLFKVIGNEALIKLAKERPHTLRQLSGSQALSHKQVGMFGEELVGVICEAMAIPEEKLPSYPHKPPPAMDPHVPQRLKLLKKWRDARARDLELDPALVCSKSLMLAIALHNPRSGEDLKKIKELRTWQRREFGREILAALRRKATG